MKCIARLVLLGAIALSATTAAADAVRDAILAELARQARASDPGFAGFSAERGAAFYRSVHSTTDPKTTSCASCHGNDPRRLGENVKTGRSIEPMAVSQNAKRYTNAEDVEKWFRRNCKEVLNRECTAVEKGDFITFMTAQ
jgi:cytochrome c553